MLRDRATELQSRAHVGPHNDAKSLWPKIVIVNYAEGARARCGNIGLRDGALVTTPRQPIFFLGLISPGNYLVDESDFLKKGVFEECVL